MSSKEHKELIAELRAIRFSQKGNEDFMTTTEAAAYMGISQESLYKLIQKGMIASHKPNGRLTFIKKADLLEYLDRGRTEGKMGHERQVERIVKKLRA